MRAACPTRRGIQLYSMAFYDALQILPGTLPHLWQKGTLSRESLKYQWVCKQVKKEGEWGRPLAKADGRCEPLSF